MPLGGDSTADAGAVRTNAAVSAAATATSRWSVVDCISGDLLWWMERPSGEGRGGRRDRELARDHVVDRAERRQRVEQLAGDVPLEGGPRVEDVEAAETTGLGVRQPRLRDETRNGRHGRSQLIAQLGVLDRI